MAYEGKRMRKAREAVDRNMQYSIDEAVKLIKQNATTKFDETVEIAMNLGVDPRHADQMVRGVVNLPNGTGRSVRVAVFAKGDKAEEAKKAGADIVGAEELAEDIQKGKIDFDRCIATPDMMPLVGKLGKVLGQPSPSTRASMSASTPASSSTGGTVTLRPTAIATTPIARLTNAAVRIVAYTPSQGSTK